MIDRRHVWLNYEPDTVVDRRRSLQNWNWLIQTYRNQFGGIPRQKGDRCSGIYLTRSDLRTEYSTYSGSSRLLPNWILAEGRQSVSNVWLVATFWCGENSAGWFYWKEFVLILWENNFDHVITIRELQFLASFFSKSLFHLNCLDSSKMYQVRLLGEAPGFWTTFLLVKLFNSPFRLRQFLVYR